MNTVTHGLEVPSNDDMIFEKREPMMHDGFAYEIVIKSSRKPLLRLAEHAMFSTLQILDSFKNEVFHELYPSILSEIQADKIVKSIESDPARFVNKEEE